MWLNFALALMASLLISTKGMAVKDVTVDAGDVGQYKTKSFENAVLFQEDMLMRERTVKRALNGEDVTKPDDYDKKYLECDQGNGPCAIPAGFVASSISRWPAPQEIPYVMSKSAKCSFGGRIKHWFLGLFDKSRKCHQTAIEDGIKEWERKTCIRFKQVSESEARNLRGYIEFTSSGYGKCYAHVGFIGGRQVVNIDDGCSTTGIVLHEIGHALGLHHEQSRPDRDDYVQVQMQNVQPGTELNFKKYSFYEVTTAGTPYDYNSIMHYGKNYFSKNGGDTIIPIVNGRLRSDINIGQRTSLSQYDIQAVKNIYCK